jgi:hypothetical protein
MAYNYRPGVNMLIGGYENHKDVIMQGRLARLAEHKKTNGLILFRYKITVEASHENTIKLFNGSLLRTPENAITDFINNHRGQQEGEFEAVLTPLGSQFESPATKLSYDTYVNHYCDIVSSLRDAINGLNLDPHIKLIAKSNSRAINAKGEEVYGPIYRCMPIF